MTSTTPMNSSLKYVHTHDLPAHCVCRQTTVNNSFSSFVERQTHAHSWTDKQTERDRDRRTERQTDRQLSQTRLHSRLRAFVVGDVRSCRVWTCLRQYNHSPLSVYSELRPVITLQIISLTKRYNEKSTIFKVSADIWINIKIYNKISSRFCIRFNLCSVVLNWRCDIATSKWRNGAKWWQPKLTLNLHPASSCITTTTSSVNSPSSEISRYSLLLIFILHNTSTSGRIVSLSVIFQPLKSRSERPSDAVRHSTTTRARVCVCVSRRSRYSAVSVSTTVCYTMRRIAQRHNKL